MRFVRLVTFGFALFLVAFSSSALQKDATTAKKEPVTSVNMTGEISDSQCAYKVHSTSGSHEEMMKLKGMGGTPQACTRICVEKMGGVYVFVRPGNVETIYHLDNEDKAAPYAGKKVKAVVNISPNGKNLYLVSISAL